MNTKAIQSVIPLTMQKAEFEWISAFMYERTGIALHEGKQALVMGRLDKRLRSRGLSSYKDYFALLGRPGYEDETTVAIDLLTTNETYFFREPKHFEFLQKIAIPQFQKQRHIRIWSAASSSGEEAYTIAMTLAEYFPHHDWEVIGTDISTRMVERAQRGLYPMQAAEKIPTAFLKKYCLKGREEFEDFFLMEATIRQHVHFSIANLIEPLPEFGMFEIIFLRNVMIYFDRDTKKRLVEKISAKLRPGGYFIVSHSETLNGLDSPFKLVTPSIYQKSF